jgi:hypothetical protein
MKNVLAILSLVAASSVAFAGSAETTSNFDKVETCTLVDLTTLQFDGQKISGSVVGKVEKYFISSQLVDVKFVGVNTLMNLSNSIVTTTKLGSVVMVSKSDLENSCNEKIVIGNQSSGNTLIHLVGCKDESLGILDCK